jgi:hypothetical protein
VAFEPKINCQLAPEFDKIQCTRNQTSFRTSSSVIAARPQQETMPLALGAFHGATLTPC